MAPRLIASTMRCSGASASALVGAWLSVPDMAAANTITQSCPGAVNCWASVTRAANDGSAAGLSAQDEALLEQFAQRYGQHIQAEEGTAYPSAQALLGEGDLRTMGLEMAGRRRAS